MAGNALVTYAGSDESIQEVAEIVAQELSASRERVDVLPIQRAHDVEGYSELVLGSQIRNRRVLPEAVEFVGRHRDSLRQMHVVYFFIAAGLDVVDRENQSLVRRYLARFCQVAPEIRPAAVGIFPRLDHRDFAMPDRVTRRRRWLPESALYDWLAVRNWASTVDLALAPNSSIGGRA